MVATNISNYACYYPECGKAFATKFNLRRHINVSHLEIKAHPCPVCQKRFASKQNLKEHMYIHTGEKPFQCQVPGCTRSFRQASQLTFHKRAHFRIGLAEISEKKWRTGTLLSLLASSIREEDEMSFVLACKPNRVQHLPPLAEDRKETHWKLPIAAGLLA